MNRNLKTFFRLGGLALILFGLLGNLPQGWSIALVAMGFVGLIAGGGGG
jgi:hypothetical protein